MIDSLFKMVCIIFILIALYNIFNVGFIEKFKVGIQNASSLASLSNASLSNATNASKIDIHDSNVSASDIRSIFDTKNIENEKNIVMDLRDLYQNLCPLDYHLNMIKLKDMVTQKNQYPGYAENTFIDLTRQIKSDKPLPTTADFFK